MFTVNIKLELFSINELEKDSKRKAIDSHRDFLIDTYSDEDFDSSFNMTRSKYKKSLTNSYVIEEIEANDYLYFKDGELADTIQYTGKHERSGEHVLTFNNEEYILKD